MSGPVAQVAAAARRIGNGDFDAEVDVRSEDEIGQLGQAINDMRSRLKQAYKDLEVRNTALNEALNNLKESIKRVELLEQIKGELSKFVPESVKRLLEKNPHATELEKRETDVSVLFLDIAGYTRLSEEMDPKQLNRLVQSYFSSFLETIHNHGGDVNETAGDGLMVVFQSDRSEAEHALNAARSALAIQQQVEELNAQFAGIFQPVFLHMGINSGLALVGATKLLGEHRSPLDVYGNRSRDQHRRAHRRTGDRRRDSRQRHDGRKDQDPLCFGKRGRALPQKCCGSRASVSRDSTRTVQNSRAR